MTNVPINYETLPEQEEDYMNGEGGVRDDERELIFTPDMETFFRENVVGVSAADPQAATGLIRSAKTMKIEKGKLR